MKTLIMFFFYFLFSANFLAQQIAHYTNYIDNAFYLNPSISSPLKKQVLLAYRNHWSTLMVLQAHPLLVFNLPSHLIVILSHTQVLVAFYKMTI